MGSDLPANRQAWLQEASPSEPSLWPWPCVQGLPACHSCCVNALRLLGVGYGGDAVNAA